MARDEQRRSDLLVGQAAAVDVYIGPQLDVGLDLHLPLILFSKAGPGKHVQYLLGRPSFGQQRAILAMTWNSILAGRRDDDRATLPHDLIGGAHALAALVQVLIQWIAAVCRDHD